jgi:2-hydroxychromene-2-carboxylate isomerase
MQRQCAKYGLPWHRPSVFPRNALLAARIALQGEGSDWIDAFCEQVMLANFAHDREIGDAAVIAGILTELGVDGAARIAAAGTDACKEALRARTAAALARGIFGAPMFFVGDDMFWGNDRLEDAIAHATNIATTGGTPCSVTS